MGGCCPFLLQQNCKRVSDLGLPPSKKKTHNNDIHITRPKTRRDRGVGPNSCACGLLHVPSRGPPVAPRGSFGVMLFFCCGGSRRPPGFNNVTPGCKPRHFGWVKAFGGHRESSRKIPGAPNRETHTAQEQQYIDRKRNKKNCHETDNTKKSTW